MNGRHSLRLSMFIHQRGLCYWCEKPMLLVRWKPGKRQPNTLATFDHVIPLSQEGPADLTQNTVLACHKCNCTRGNTDARMFMLTARSAYD